MSYQVFNKNRYLELLIKETNSSLSELEEEELTSYQIILQNQITYNNRQKYIFLLEEHIKESFDDLNNSLETTSAIVQISELFDQDLEYFCFLKDKILKEGITVLEDFSIDSLSNSDEFSDLITDVLQCGEEQEIAEEDYFSIMEINLSNLRDCANGVSITFNDNKVLQFVMVFFTIVTLFAYSILDPHLFSLIWQNN